MIDFLENNPLYATKKERDEAKRLSWDEESHKHLFYLFP